MLKIHDSSVQTAIIYLSVNWHNSKQQLYLGVKSYLAGQRPTNWGHYLYYSKVDRDLSRDTHTHINTRLRGPTV